MTNKININIELEFENSNENKICLNENDIDWEVYSKNILDSIEIIDSEEESKRKDGINPFLEIKYYSEKDETISFPDKRNDINLDNNFQSWDNYKLKELQKIAEFYNISYKGKTKNKLIEKIIEFEEKEENCMKIYDREVKWNMMNQLLKDKFFSKYIINWNN